MFRKCEYTDYLNFRKIINALIIKSKNQFMIGYKRKKLLKY